MPGGCHWAASQWLTDNFDLIHGKVTSKPTHVCIRLDWNLGHFIPSLLLCCSVTQHAIKELTFPKLPCPVPLYTWSFWSLSSPSVF